MLRAFRYCPQFVLSVLVVALFSAADAAIVVQPYLQNPTETTMDILWWTDTECADNRVEYGDGWQSRVDVTPVFVATMGRYLCQATITGLAPGTPYPYRVISGEETSGEYIFATSPSADQAAVHGVHIGILGDGRTDNEAVRRRHRQIACRWQTLSRRPGKIP